MAYSFENCDAGYLKDKVIFAIEVSKIYLYSLASKFPSGLMKPSISDFGTLYNLMNSGPLHYVRIFKTATD